MKKAISERQFRVGQVAPLLKKLPNTHVVPVQQVAIRGTPDYLLCIQGQFIALELKAVTGRLSKLQEHTLDQIERCGGRSYVATPENWGGIKGLLQSLAGE